MHYLDKIDSPKDLKKLKPTQLKTLAQEIRDFMLHSVSKTGGHLASNLGVVELTIALHYCLNSPSDKIVWDVGHQSYPHKMLTGRREQFDTLRQMDGLSGYIKSAESPHDAFDVGHSSTSLSAALGMAVSRDLLGRNNRVAVVIGDGSLTSGLALEGLNNIGRSDTDIVVFLNDNQMSISENVGALSRYLNDLRSAPSYISAKQDVRKFLKGIPLAGRMTENFIEKTKSQLKYFLLPGVLFQELGFKYYGPIDGHNINQLISVIQNVKEIRGPILVHVITKKGKGYGPAERKPHKFHGVGPFDLQSGRPKTKDKVTYTDIFAKKIVELGKSSPNIVAITASMSEGTGLVDFKRHFPKRFFDVGIAESHAVTFAAGLAASGIRPIVSIYSTFMQRAYDQILHDVCIQNLPVVFVLDRAGIVGGDGETHQGVFDLSYLSHMPNMTVLAPKDGAELEAMLDFAFTQSGPVAIRYPKDTACKIHAETAENGDIALVSVGAMFPVACKVQQMLADSGFAATLISPYFIKPWDKSILEDLRKYSRIFSMEENVYDGGFGQRLTFALQGMNIHCFAIPDAFLPTGTREELFKLAGLDAESIFNRILEILTNETP